MRESRITVFLADDNLIVREGVRALLGAEPDLEVIGVGAELGEVLSGVDRTAPQVLVTDIRMPPSFQSEGIDAAKQIRKAHPGTGVVVLSQYDDPEYAMSLLEQGTDGYAYLLKDRVAEGDQLARAIRAVAAGGSMLDAKIVDALVRPVAGDGELGEPEEDLLRMIAAGKPIKVIAASRGTTPADANAEIEKLFLKIAQQASTGAANAIRKLQSLHAAIVQRDEIEESLGRLLPTGLADKLRAEGRRIGETERLTVTVLVTDVRGYSGIAEVTDPSLLARQLSAHRALVTDVILAAGGTVMTFTGDGVLAVFGPPFSPDDHADRALAAARDINAKQATLNEGWAAEELVPFSIGIGLSTGDVAAALLGSEDRPEYTVIGDTVNLAARLQDLARPGGTICMSEATYQGLDRPPPDAERLEGTAVKGRAAPIVAYRVNALGSPSEPAGYAGNAAHEGSPPASHSEVRTVGWNSSL